MLKTSHAFGRVGSNPAHDDIFFALALCGCLSLVVRSECITKEGCFFAWLEERWWIRCFRRDFGVFEARFARYVLEQQQCDKDLFIYRFDMEEGVFDSK